ncbi:MAG: hypothetical protein V1929_03425 [bacterium]
MAAWFAAGKMKRDCAACGADPTLKETWGCESEEKYVLWRGTGYQLEVHGCPMRALEGWERRCFDLHQHYQEGRLPVKGGVLDQSAQALAAFEFIDDLMQALKPKEK